MFFSGSEKHSVLNLNAADATGAEIAAGTFASAKSELNIEDKVKQHFEQIREPLARYLTSTFGGERSQAEEITQEAFLQLYRYMAKGHPIQNVRAWTFRIGHNMAVQRLKKQQFLSPLADEEWDELTKTLEGKDPNPEQNLLQKERLTRLRNAIGRLTEIERQCLNLRTKGFRYREIGEIVDISTRSVAGTLYRVIEKLAKEANE